MKMNQKPTKKGKGATVGLVICFVAAIALVGTYTLKHYKSGVEDQLAAAEKETEEKEKREEDTRATNNLVINTKEKEPEVTEEAPQNVEEIEEQPTEASETSGGGVQINFSENDKLLWPVSGNVLLNYSMDKTVYFSTLDQYKYNPALLISGAVNDQVISAAPGVVKSIDVTAQTGNSVTVDLGNGYEAIYGQLKEVPVKVGDYVEAKTVLGYLSEPTKYYSVEGCNLYFQINKDAQPVNPMEFLEN